MPQQIKISALTETTLDGTDVAPVVQGGVTYKARITALPTGSADNAILRADGTGGYKGQTSTVSIDDLGNIAPVTSDAGALGTTSLQWSDAFFASGAVINFANGDVTITHATDTLAFAGAATAYTFSGGPVSPSANDGVALGTTTLGWADIFFATGGTIHFANTDWVATHSTGILTVSTGDLRVTTAGTNSASVVTVGGTQTLTNKTLASPTITGSITAGSFIPSSATIPSNGMYLPAGNTLGWAINSAAEVQLTSTALSPAANDGNALGTTALSWADLFLATGAVINFNAGDVTITHAANTLTFDGASSGYAFTGGPVVPATNDAAALGTTTLGWADIFFATGGTIHFANTDWVATHTTGILTVGTGDLRVTNNFTNAASVVTVGGSQTLTNKTLTSPVISGGTINNAVIGGTTAVAGTFTTLTVNTNANPDANDGAGLGTGALGWSDLFLASGAVINFANGDTTLTHASAVLTLAGGGFVLAAGTTALTPLTFTAGTNLTTPGAGAKEYDGTVFYATPVAQNRGVDIATHFLSLSANQTGTNVNTAQPWFPGGGATGLTVAANTTYMLDGYLYLTKTAGTTARTLGIGFGGTATVTSILYDAAARTEDAAAATLGTISFLPIATAANTTVTASSSSANQAISIRVRGLVRINGAGTFIPQFTYSAAPGGAPTANANSFFRMTPLGSGSALSVGNWV